MYEHPFFSVFSRILLIFGLSMLFAASVLGFLYGLELFKKAIETKLEEKILPYLPLQIRVQIENPPPSADSSTAPLSQEQISGFATDLTSSSFSDLFSGVGWIDQGHTTFYQDRIVTGFLFPPRFETRKFEGGEPEQFKNLRFIERAEDDSDTRCIGERCLREKSSLLYFKDKSQNQFKRVYLPASLRAENLSNISIGVLDTKWLVGAVFRSNGAYRGKIFYFDGSDFEEVFNGEESKNSLTSEYEGIFGFGGSDTNWVAVYGAYQGFGYEITDLNGARSYKPISGSFFGIRVMRNGFQPAVLRSGPEPDTVWYVFSISEGNPVLVKLFENRTGVIQGGTDLTQRLLSLDMRKVSFAVLKFGDAEIVLAAKIKNDSGKEEFWEIYDKGFEKDTTREVFSSNINNYTAEIRNAKIAELDLGKGGAAIRFFLSNNGVDWFLASPGQEIPFPQRNGRGLFWRAEFKPDTDPYTSPFLDRIHLDYRVKFL